MCEQKSYEGLRDIRFTKGVHESHTRRMAPKGKKKKKSGSYSLEEIRKLEFTVKTRGFRIGAMYHAIQQLLRNHPHVTQFQMPDPDSDQVESLRIQLSQARTLLAQQALPKDEVDPAANPSIKTYPLHADCPLCYEQYNEGEKKAVAFGCGHIYCEECMFRYLKTTSEPTCAQCRRPVEKFLPLFF